MLDDSKQAYVCEDKGSKTAEAKVCKSLMKSRNSMEFYLVLGHPNLVLTKETVKAMGIKLEGKIQI